MNDLGESKAPWSQILTFVGLISSVGTVVWAASQISHSADSANESVRSIKIENEKSNIRMSIDNEKANIKLSDEFKKEFGVLALTIDRMRLQIDGIPEERAKVGQIERRMNDAISALDKHDSRLGILEQNQYRVQTQIDGLVRGSNVPLPPAVRR